MNAVRVLPWGLVQVSVTPSTIAPAKVVEVVIVSAEGSLVCAVQVPLPRSVPPFSAQSNGTPAIVTVIGSLGSADKSVSAMLMALPATPAGSADVVIGVAVFPAISVTVAVIVLPVTIALPGAWLVLRPSVQLP